MNVKKIHFVCLGNAFRSRLAEAYAKSLELDGFEFSSSGIAAHLFEQRLPKHAEIPARKHQILSRMSSGQHQTTNEILEEQDLIIFMKPDVLKEANKLFKVDERKVIEWNVDDLWQAMAKKRLKDPDTERALRLSFELFDKIKAHVDALADDISKRAWIDIYDSDNKHTGLRLPIDLANKKALWHRGIHALVLTPDGKYVVEKRSNSLMIARSLLDISLGGYVDAGEHPDATAVRETNEELGLDVDASQLHFLQVTKAASYHPHYKRHTKGFTYSYLIKLKPHQVDFKPQRSEVSEIYLLSPASTKKLIKLRRLRRFGRLNYSYKLYESVLSSAENLIN